MNLRQSIENGLFHLIFDTPRPEEDIIFHWPPLNKNYPPPQFWLIYPSTTYRPQYFSQHPLPRILSSLPLFGIPLNFFGQQSPRILSSLPLSGIHPLIFFRDPPPSAFCLLYPSPAYPSSNCFLNTPAFCLVYPSPAYSLNFFRTAAFCLLYPSPT